MKGRPILYVFCLVENHKVLIPNSRDKTIEALEKQIKALRDIKANFEASEQKLLKANEIADEDLTVKKLTYGNPTIRKMIQDAAGQAD